MQPAGIARYRPPPLPKYTGDLSVLQSHGKLRVIVPPEPLAHMPKHAEPVTLDYDLARGLASRRSSWNWCW